MRYPKARRPLVLLTGATALTLSLAACGGSSGSSSSSSGSPGAAVSSKLAAVKADPALAAKVPKAVASDGTITVGTDATYAPNEFLAKDGKTAVGFDVDLFRAVAAKLGLKATFSPTPFGSDHPPASPPASTRPGSRRSPSTRTGLKQTNMVSYFSAGTQWGAKRGNPDNIDPANACGKKIAVQKATVQVEGHHRPLEEVHVGGQGGHPDRPVPGPGPGDRGGGVRQGPGDAGGLPGGSRTRSCRPRGSWRSWAPVYGVRAVRLRGGEERQGPRRRPPGGADLADQRAGTYKSDPAPAGSSTTVRSTTRRSTRSS